MCFKNIYSVSNIYISYATVAFQMAPTDTKFQVIDNLFFRKDKLNLYKLNFCKKYQPQHWEYCNLTMPLATKPNRWVEYSLIFTMEYCVT